MVGTQLEFVGGAEHAFADSTTQFAFLDFVEFGVGGPNFGADLGTNHFLTDGHIRSAADDVEGFGGTHIDRGEMQMVRIGMRFASEHLGYHHVFQSTFDGFHLIDALYLETRESQQVVQLVWIQSGLHIIFQPII